MKDPIPAVGNIGTGFNMIAKGSKIEADWDPPESSSIDKIVLAKVTVETDDNKIYIGKIDNSAMVKGVSLRKVISSRKLWESQLQHLLSACSAIFKINNYNFEATSVLSVELAEITLTIKQKISNSYRKKRENF
jgi:hypothetical protein